MFKNRMLYNHKLCFTTSFCFPYQTSALIILANLRDTIIVNIVAYTISCLYDVDIKFSLSLKVFKMTVNKLDISISLPTKSSSISLKIMFKIAVKPLQFHEKQKEINAVKCRAFEKSKRVKIVE